MGEHRAVLWADERQLPMVMHAARAGGFVIAACGSDHPGETGVLSERLKSDAVTDLRSALSFESADATWIASPAGMTREHLEIARRMNRPVLTAMPWPPDAKHEASATPLRVLPLLRRADLIRASTELLLHDDRWRAAHIAWYASIETLPLANLLYGALDFVVSHTAGVESICATLAGPQPVPETIAGLTGHLCVHLRLDDGSTASITLSDRAGHWARRIELLSSERLMELDDTGSRLYREGNLSDEQRAVSDQSIAAVIGREIAAVIDGQTLDHPPDHARICMLCDTVLLACRTGQAESPRTIERMSEHV